MSVQTGTPAGMPTRTSPEAPLAVSRPRWAVPIDEVAAAGASARRRRCASPTLRSPEPVLTTVGPAAVPISTSPEPVETATADAGAADVDVAGAALDPQLGARLLEPDVAGAGLDERRARRRSSSWTSPEPLLTCRTPSGAVDGDVGAAGLDGEVAVGRDGDGDVEPGVAAEEAGPLRGAITVIWSPCCSTTDLVGVAAGRPATWVSVVSVAMTLDGALADLDEQARRAAWVSKWYSVMSLLQGVLVRGAGRCAGPSGVCWWVGGPVVRPSRSCGGWPRLPAAERVVAAEERDAGQVDVDVDRVLAGRGADDVDQPGVERVAGPGRQLLGLGLDRLGDPQRDPGEAALLLGLLGRRRGRRRGRGRRRWARPATTKSSSRPLSRTSTPPAGISAVISAAAWEMASISASRAAGSSAKREPLGGLPGLGAGGLGGGDAGRGGGCRRTA